MGLCNRPDIFQENISELFLGLDTVHVYIDEFLCVTKGFLTEHLTVLEDIFTRLQKAGLKVNASKSWFGSHKFDHLGYHVTCNGVMPISKKFEAMQSLVFPKNRKQLCQFICMIKFYRDMWQKRSEILAPLTTLTSKNVKYEWKDEHQNIFDAIKRVIGREVFLVYPYFNFTFKYIMMPPNYILVQSYLKRASPSLSIQEIWTAPNIIWPQLRNNSFP